MEESDVERSLDSSVKDGCAYAQMMGFAEASFGACAVALKATDRMVGLLGTLPPFIGACMQPIAARLVDRTGRRRPLYMWGAAVQELAFIPICAAVFLPTEIAFWVLLAGVIVYFGGVNFCVPPWNSLMGELVRPEIRGRFFSYRNAVAVVSQGMAMLAAGYGLKIFKERGHELWGFAVIFAAAMVSRLISIWHLGRMKEPPFGAASPAERAPFADKRIESNFVGFALFIAAWSFSTAISGPYFTPYMLRDLGFSYLELMIASAVVIVGQIPLLPRWGRLCDRYGNRRIMVVTAACIAIGPVLWMLSWNIATVVATQIFLGAVWAGFSLAVGNFLLDSLPRERWASGAARLNLLSGIAILLGGLFGSWIVDFLPRQYVFLGVHVTFFSHLQVIMLISTLLRVAAIILLLRRFSEVRRVPNASFMDVLLGSEGRPGDPSSL